MRLLTKTTLYFLLAMIPLLMAGGVFLFFQFSKELDNEMDQELINDELQWIRYIDQQTAENGPFILKTPELLIYPVNAGPEELPTVSDTYQYQAIARARVPYRQLSQVVVIQSIRYQIIIRKSQVQKSALVTNVTRTMFFVFTGLFIATLLFNWVISNRLWKPFHRSLEKIRGAELHKMEAIRFDPNTSIHEFNELNASLNLMSEKIYTDYLTIKEFTEDAAHEMQTPLAVAQSKLELILQDTNLTDEQVNYIMEASEAIKRLGKLSQSLLFLAKIENNQYETNESISLNKISLQYLQLFDEIIKDRQIIVETRLEGEFKVSLHTLLAESLVSNLLGNAIKYNYKGGSILLHITSDKFIISNTSHLPPINPDQLFRRFKKISIQNENSTGLGLAIVKKIADTNRLSISYQANNGIHQFALEKSR
jgi:signal transduction histidine kinase